MKPALQGHLQTLLSVHRCFNMVTIEDKDIQSVLGLTSSPTPVQTAPSSEEEMPLKDILNDFEKNVLQQTFKKYEGNVSRMASALQTDRANLHKKLKKYGIK
jgi:DNA-binding NtrC family response regulator